MSSGPFGDRTVADAASEEINQYFFNNGFGYTLIGLLEFLQSLPQRPDQPTLALLEMLGIPHERLDVTEMMTILRGYRSEIAKIVRENRKLQDRLDELREKLMKEQQDEMNNNSVTAMMDDMNIDDGTEELSDANHKGSDKNAK
ncbi:hypothetical protein KIN20_011934 [Parelaphostrongylus tenuis]|uniref:Uncharacterized protein n=1 Tax=Parelaphostrongylus tenuis TaxID=148309 RepID=A0AAD5MDP4_PARTN|nr:hypothetical protein KIN20_011934 [Parelaphostrongylus tenuis]